MSIDVTATTRIARAASEVAAFMFDPAHEPEWINGIKTSEPLDAPPLAEGSKVARVASFLGKRIEYVNEVTRLDETTLDMRSVKAPFPMRITYTLEPHGDADTTVTNRVRGGGSRLMAPLVRRNIQRDLDRLKRLLETG